ncbi:nuclear pore glycoprotein p62 [Vespa velutina]|uniref:nuclear pore glycoprotein p62 n=1 Tax=Vespa velutina TaxID=202808 RepID=UPI001FB26597|nr:nuclear pore glycoprotein p62 [Vespa velutina]
MNFGFDPSKTQDNVATTTNVATPTGFSFGFAGAGDASKQVTSGLTVTPVQNKPGGFFGSGITTPGQSTSFTFGNTPNTCAPTIGATITPVTGFGVSTLASSTANASTPSTVVPTGFNLQSTPTVLTGTEGAQTSATTGISFGTPSSVPSSTTGFNIGGTITTATTTTTPIFTFGNPTTTTPTVTGLSQDAAKTSTIQTGFTPTPFTTAGFGLTNTPAATTATVFSLNTATTTSAASIFSIGTTASSTTGFMLNKTTSVTAPSNVATVTTHTTLGTTTTVSSSANAIQPGAINFCQLEESINKWTLELEEQEKVFVNQATQVNAWDKLLITNGEKIVTLNQEVERVKLEQQQLEHELDYVVGQQKELQDCLVPLEKELASLSVSDPEREYTYRLAENIDTQLKQMSEDLKEIIEHLNEANRVQDSSDPIVQIGKILNAHMNSLQWLDQRTALLTQKIQQIDQMHQNFRQENERSFNLAYN